MTSLVFPTYPFKLEARADGTYVLDEFRRQWVKCTPEEWVRQHLAVYMRDHLNYPSGRIALEVSLQVYNLRRRADLLFYSIDGKPALMAECKAPDVEITQKTFDQISNYNISIGAQILVLTNGKVLYCAKYDLQKNKWEFQSEIPMYA